MYSLRDDEGISTRPEAQEETTVVWGEGGEGSSSKRSRVLIFYLRRSYLNNLVCILFPLFAPLFTLQCGCLLEGAGSRSHPISTSMYANTFFLAYEIL